MAALANLVPGSDGLQQIEQVFEEYGSWIEEKRGASSALTTDHGRAAKLNLDECSKALSRMKSGLRFLERDPQAIEGI